MYKIVVSLTIDAAHRLENYKGPCARLHGHTYTITGEWEKETQDHIGMVLDMVGLKKQLHYATVDMDHHFLNKVPALQKPTAENMSRLIYQRLAKAAHAGKYLAAVEVEETPGCSVRYWEPQIKSTRTVREAVAEELLVEEPKDESK